jgi:hypothetical protein
VDNQQPSLTRERLEGSTTRKYVPETWYMNSIPTSVGKSGTVKLMMTEDIVWSVQQCTGNQFNYGNYL